MPCGKKPLIKNWDKSRNIRRITPSRYEQNEPSVKVHWKKVVRDLELSYKDDKFWESQSDTVRELVGPIIFRRIAKIFNLPVEAISYEPKSPPESPIPSEQFYVPKLKEREQKSRSKNSISDVVRSEEEEEEVQEEQSEDQWSVSSIASIDMKKASFSPSKSMTKSFAFSKSTTKSFSKIFGKIQSRSRKSVKSLHDDIEFEESLASSGDDMFVHRSSAVRRDTRTYGSVKNPHFEMLYCVESETDMIKWNSKIYKQKEFAVSASDEFSKKAEILTKQIAKDFYDWWVSLGSVEFKSEIKRPEDIEDLFQVWFDEHASRGLMLHPKILPCVLESIAKYVGDPSKSCQSLLKRQIAYDIRAETTPAHVMAFGTGIPPKMKHIPPQNNTKATWHCVKIPEDLRTMSCVWDDILHLTSTKAFQNWLEHRPFLPMPPCLKSTGSPAEKKQLFVVPSDYIGREITPSAQEMALPVSQFSLELNKVLSKIMNS